MTLSKSAQPATSHPKNQGKRTAVTQYNQKNSSKMDDIHNAKLFNCERYIPGTNHHYYSIPLSKDPLQI